MLFFFSHAWNKGPPSFVKQICGLLFRVMHVNDYNEIAFLFEDENDMQSDIKMKKRGATAFQKQYVSLTKRNFAYKLFIVYFERTSAMPAKCCLKQPLFGLRPEKLKEKTITQV